MSAPENLSGSGPSGMATMSPAMREMRSYPAYLLRWLEPCLGRRVWEIGVGYGLYTDWLLNQGLSVLGSDIDRDCLQSLEDKYPEHSQLQLACIDLTSEDSVRSATHFAADSVICMNVMEHIEQDVNALTWIRQSCAPGAKLGLIVPAHPWLFGRMDVEAGHFRRYTLRTTADTLRDAGWRAMQLRYVNALGAVGWWYHNRWRKQAGLTDAAVNRHMKFADHWLPRIARCTDPLLSRCCGLSVVAHAQA